MAKAKGSPKTGGRTTGTANKVTSEVRAVAMDYSVEAIDGLVAIGRDPSAPAAARVSAWSAVLDRAVGKPTQAITGRDGEPVQFKFKMISPEMSPREAADAYAATLDA